MRSRLSIALLLPLVLAAAASPARGADFTKFGFQTASAHLSDLRAGAHPDFVTEFSLETDPSSPAGETTGDHYPYAELDDLTVELPPGLLANLNAVDECSIARFNTGTSENKGCPFSSQVGTTSVRVYNQAHPYVASIFRLETNGSEGDVARLGFFVFVVPVFIDVRVRSDSDYGATAEVKGLPVVTPVESVKTILWGVPGDASHDHQRFMVGETAHEAQASPARPTGKAPAPFMTNPTSCGEPLQVKFSIDSYQEPGVFREATAPLGEIEDCAGVKFEPGLSLTPTTRATASPSGVDATLAIPQDESVGGRSTSQLRGAVIQLPEGLTISPGAADGLAACGAVEAGYGVSPPAAAHCPEAAKIATATIDSPSLSRPIQGAVYQRTPEPGHLTRAWLVADELGVHVKIPGEFLLDPATGRITSLFLETPQVPLRRLELHFKGGPRGVLATPPACGTYSAHFSFTPWAGGADAEGEAPMTFDEGCAPRGFAPQLAAGVTDPIAGAFSPLVAELTQASGEPNLSRLEVTLPPGALAKVAGVPLCPESAAATGSCPAAALLGRVVTAAGPGPAPLWIPQPGKAPTAVYLAGPYEGAPYSLVVVVPAQAGPFDLGDVIVRTALRVDPRTARVSAVSDPLPQILEGVPISYRDIRVEIDRPGFTLNPTNCGQLAAGGSASSVSGAAASLSSPFRVTGCGKLAFKPRLRLSLSGPTHRAAHPALRAVLTMPPGGSNIGKARVNLPHSEFLDQGNIGTVCTQPQLASRTCPPRSIYGRAKAWSPLLARPLEGPVYLGTGYGDPLPDLVGELDGQIRVLLNGRVDAGPNQGLRTTFETVPDAPVSRFVLEMKGGAARGLLENSEDVCRRPQRAAVSFAAQSGRRRRLAVPIANDCAHGTGKQKHQPNKGG